MPDEPPEPLARELNGHLFMPAFDVPGPFPTTSLSSSFVLAYGQTTSNLQIGNQNFSGTLDYAGIGGIVEYEQSFLRYFSARLVINDIVYSGINGSSALTIGSHVQVGITPGVTASLRLGETVRLGVLFDVQFAPSLGLTFATGIQNVVNTCQAGQCHIDLGTIFLQQNVTTIQPALAAAWAPTRGFGLTANAAYAHASGNGLTGQAAVLGAAVEFDFGAVSSVPIGLQGQVSWTAPFSGNALQHVTDVGGGLFYTGRKNLAAGIQVLNRRFAVSSGVDVSWRTFVSNVTVRYYWH
jgi:hypothetical protein